MVYKKDFLLILSVLFQILFASCTAEQLKDLTDQLSTKSLTGSYALDDGSGLTDVYISFSNGKLYKYALYTPSVLAEEYIWYANSTLRESGEYAISSGVLYCNGVPYGKVQITDEQMVLDGKTYSRIIGIKSDPYTSINVEGDLSRTLSYVKQELAIPVSVGKTISAGVLTANKSVSWISRCEIENGTLVLAIDENNSRSARNANVILTYPGAKQVAVAIKQTYEYSSLTFEPGSQDVDYTGGDFSFTFTVSNPREDAETTAVSQAEWITDVAMEGNKVTYKVAENNSGAPRTGKIRLAYGNFAIVDFSIDQAWSASVFTTNPAEQEVGYAGGTFSFEYELTNLREGMDTTVVSQAEWITAVSMTGNKVTYKVAENNTGATRTGTIRLAYGEYCIYDFIVSQLYSASSISLSPSSASMNYKGGTFSFEATVANPRDGVTLSASSSAKWISNVKISGNTVSYKVAENNSLSSRTGAIYLYYGSYYWAQFSISQSYSAATIQLSPESSSVSYAEGTYTFNCSVSNPRSGVSVSCTSEANWITDVQLSGNAISYKVAENNSGFSRSGKIKLTYGSYAAKELSVAQNGKPVQSITLNKSSIELYTGHSETLSVTVDPSDAVLSWSSSNTSVATVSSSGVVSGVARGLATITVAATDGSGKSASCQVEVKQYVTGINLNKTSLTLNEGQTETLSATVTPNNANDKTLTWTSSNTSVATVDQTGNLTAVSKGTATITATTNDGSGRFDSCSVTVKRLVSSIILDKTSIAIYNGKTETIIATVTPSTANNTGVTWSSSDTSVATVSNSGVVTGVARGAATITATSKDGSEKCATCQVEVKQYVKIIRLNKSSFAPFEGRTETLSARIFPDNANDKTLNWSSSNTSVATVDQTGKVTAVSKGFTTITASAIDGSGVSASSSVQVIDISVLVDLGLSVKWASCNLCVSGFVSSPEDYGDYYAWGETEPGYEVGYAQSETPVWKFGKDHDYFWDSYKWCNGSYDSLTKYNTSSSSWGNVDNKTVLEANDDVAHIKLGGSWRMPTGAEWTELMNNCTWTWTTLNGISGQMVTSKKNSASIFLPSAGYRHGTTFNHFGSRGYYWSSSLYLGNSRNARHMHIRSDHVYMDDIQRCDGLSVRPVSE